MKKNSTITYGFNSTIDRLYTKQNKKYERCIRNWNIIIVIIQPNSKIYKLYKVIVNNMMNYERCA